MGQFDRGYPNLAAFTSSDEDFAIYRRFGYLQARLLLDKQDQLRLLEERLDRYDESDPMKAVRKGLTPEQYAQRAKLLGEIEAVFTSYGACRFCLTLFKLINSSWFDPKQSDFNVKQSSKDERDSKRVQLPYRHVSCAYR